MYFVCILWGIVGVDKITENDSTQDYDCITKSLSPYPKTLSPGSLNSNNRVGSPVNSPKNNGINILCASVSCSPIPPALLLVRMCIHFY